MTQSAYDLFPHDQALEVELMHGDDRMITAVELAGFLGDREVRFSPPWIEVLARHPMPPAYYDDGEPYWPTAAVMLWLARLERTRKADFIKVRYGESPF